MKAVLTVLVIGIAASLLASTSQGAEASVYSSKAPFIGQHLEAVPSLTVVSVPHELSTRCALFGGHPVTITQAPPVQVASYNSKTAVRGGPPVETIELAPLK